MPTRNHQLGILWTLPESNYSESPRTLNATLEEIDMFRNGWMELKTQPPRSLLAGANVDH